jgi:DNA-binding response OmpR family regulator
MNKCVILLEDDPDLAHLVRELLEESDYHVVHVTTMEELLVEAARRAPCVALLDSTNPKAFDLWSVGHKLVELGVPPIAFTAHASAKEEFEADAHGFVGLVTKPFDADEFIQIVDSICWEENHAAAS